MTSHNPIYFHGLPDHFYSGPHRRVGSPLAVSVLAHAGNGASYRYLHDQPCSEWSPSTHPMPAAEKVCRQQWGDNLRPPFNRLQCHIILVPEIGGVAGLSRFFRRLPDKLILSLAQQPCIAARTLRNGYGAVAVVGLGCTNRRSALYHHHRLRNVDF